MDDTERAELIAALHPAATLAEALLDLNERLLNVLASGENRPDCEELEYLRAGLVAPAQVPERLARVQVGVRSASTNAVIEGATVRLLPERGPQQTCTTGDDGICQFWTALMPVAVAVSKDGFVPTETPFTLADTCYCAGGLITLVEAPRYSANNGRSVTSLLPCRTAMTNANCGRASFRRAHSTTTCCRSACGRSAKTGTTPRSKSSRCPGVGAEIVLTVDGELRKTRLFRSHEQAELVGAIADTRAMFERKGGREHRDDSERAELIGTSAPRAPLVGEGMLQRNNQLLGSCDPPTAVDIAYIRRTSTLAYRWQQAV